MSKSLSSPNPSAEEPEAAAASQPQTLVEALLPAFALGAADADEIAAVTRALHSAPHLAADLAAYAALVEHLHLAATPVTPPPSLAGKLQGALATLPAPSRDVPRDPLRLPPPGSTPAPARSPRRWHWPLAVAAAAILLLGLLNLYLLRQVDALHTEQALLRAQLDTQSAKLAQQDVHLAGQASQLAEQDALLAALVASTGERYTMHAAQEGSLAQADVAWLFERNLAVLRASAFPTLEAGHVYQLWLIRDGQRTSGGLFTVDAQGQGTLVFTPPESLDNFEGMGITPEPEGGSTGPTAPPVVTASL